MSLGVKDLKPYCLITEHTFQIIPKPSLKPIHSYTL